jgi:ubiquinone/menaquinone biosynthesis C-methylase UbiE
MDVYQPNAQYNLAKPDSLASRVTCYARRRMYDRFIRSTGIQAGESLLDVGVTSDQGYEHSNYVEAWYPYKDKITAVGIDDASFLERLYPGLVFRRANGLELPFAADSFDVVHSSAVLEHVGNLENQRRFVAELTRVARRAIFLTTPNRWFPVEFHTILPLVHWLPKPWFRRLLFNTRYQFFSREENLNLLGKGELLQLCSDLTGCSVASQSQRLLGMTSNLLLIIQKRAQLKRGYAGCQCAP